MQRISKEGGDEVIATELTSDDRYTLQMLARHQMIQRLLQDVLFDVQVCRLEGWDAGEYPRMIREAIPGRWC